MKIYPEDKILNLTHIKKADDLEYNIICGIIWGSLICICLCVLLIIIITVLIDNNIKDNSESY